MIVPAQYIVFYVFAFYGYNRPYFIGFRANELDYATFLQTVIFLCVTVAVDLCFLAFLYWIVRRNHRLDIFQEIYRIMRERFSYMMCVQCTFFVFVMSLIIVHSGVDFTFKFAWLP